MVSPSQTGLLQGYHDRHCRPGWTWDTRRWWQPKWTRDPSEDTIEQVCRLHLGIDDGAACTISSYVNSSGWAKVYLVQTAQGQFLMAVSLPLDPHYKTRGKIATQRFLRDNTSIPVSKVIAFDDSDDNEIGFEWILMERIPGDLASER